MFLGQDDSMRCLGFRITCKGGLLGCETVSTRSFSYPHPTEDRIKYNEKLKLPHLPAWWWCAQAAKMEKQKGAVEQRYVKKMDKLLTQISKETDKARVQAASARTSPFKVRK